MSENRLYFNDLPVGNYSIGLSINPDNIGVSVVDNDTFEGENTSLCYRTMSTSEDRRLYRSGRTHLAHKHARMNQYKELVAVEAERFGVDINTMFFNPDEDPDERLRSFCKKSKTIQHFICDVLDGKVVPTPEEYYAIFNYYMKHRGHTYMRSISVENLGKSDYVKDFLTRFQQYYPEKNLNVKNVESLVKAFLTGNKTEKRAVLDDVTDGKKTLSYLIFSSFITGNVTKELYSTLFEFAPFYRKEGKESGFKYSQIEEIEEELRGNLGSKYYILEELIELNSWFIASKLMGNYKFFSFAYRKRYNQRRREMKVIRKAIEDARGKKEARAYFNNPDYENGYKQYCDRECKDRCGYSAFKEKLLKKILEDCHSDAAKEVKSWFNTQSPKYHVVLDKPMSATNSLFPRSIKQYEFETLLDMYINEYGVVDDNFRENMMILWNFDIPYWAGPTSEENPNYWMVKKSNQRINAFNFYDVVDSEATQHNFIDRLIGYCSIIPTEKVMAKNCPSYNKAVLLNILNCIKVDGKPIKITEKNDILDMILNTTEKVTKSVIVKYLNKNYGYNKNATVTGIPDEIPQTGLVNRDMQQIIGEKRHDTALVDDIVFILTYSQTKESKINSLRQKLGDKLSEDEINTLAGLSYSGWGNMSEFALCKLNGKNGKSIVETLYDTNMNLQQILYSDDFKTVIAEYNMKNCHVDNKYVSMEVLEKMFPFNSYRDNGAIMRVVTQISRIAKKRHASPKNIVIISTRHDGPKENTLKRKENLKTIYESQGFNKKKATEEEVALYKLLCSLKDEDFKATKTFCYFLQFGYNIYTGKPISFEQISAKDDEGEYLLDSDHIYPRSLGGENSIRTNIVLTSKILNKKKGDTFPFTEYKTKDTIALWRRMVKAGTMSEEKFIRLMRDEPYLDKEAEYFLEGMMTAKGKIAKTVKTVIEYFGIAEKVSFIKSDIIFDFRKKYECARMKNNNYYYAHDAYLAVILSTLLVRWISCKKESGVTKFFEHPIVIGDKTFWAGDKDVRYARVLRTVKSEKPKVVFVKDKTLKAGKLFNATKVKGSCLGSERRIPLKRNKNEKDGGYKSLAIAFFYEGITDKGEKTHIPIPKIYCDDPVAIDEYLKTCKEQVTNRNRIYPGTILNYNDDEELPIVLKGMSKSKHMFAPAKEFEFDEKYTELYNCCIKTKELRPVLKDENDEVIKEYNPVSGKNEVVYLPYNTDIVTKSACVEFYQHLIDQMLKERYYRVFCKSGIEYLIQRKSFFEELNEYKMAVQLVLILEWLGCTSCALKVDYIKEQIKKTGDEELKQKKNNPSTKNAFGYTSFKEIEEYHISCETTESDAA